MSDDLSKAVATVLTDYKESVIESVQRVTKEVANEGLRKVKAASPVSGKSPKRSAYKSGWTKKVVVNRMGASANIYNGKYPGLVHLLEKGHALRNGGRARAQVHVAPVQDWMNEELRKRIEEAIKK
jgi:hypothetical protein